MIILIGSRALSHSNANPRPVTKDTDWDFIIDYDEIKHMHLSAIYPTGSGKYHARSTFGDIFDFEIVSSRKSNDLLKKLVENHSELFDTETSINISGIMTPVIIPIPVISYLFKASHIYLKNNPFFEKTRNDVLWMIENDMDKFPDHLSSDAVADAMIWFDMRVDETYHYEHPNLDQTKDEFFSGDGVIYHYDHDWLHEQVAILDKPAYKYYQSPDKEVLCSQTKFLALPFKHQLYGVAEEAMVLALERSIIAFNTNPIWAKKKALQKVCTSITSGWFRKFAWMNYDKVWDILATMPIPSNLKLGLDDTKNT